MLTLTAEHNLAGLKKRNGEPVVTGDASYLLRYLGMQEPARKLAHTSTGVLQPGQVLLLCSDGVPGQLDADTMREYLFTADAAALVEAAAEDLYADNCTAVVVRRAASLK